MRGITAELEDDGTIEVELSFDKATTPSLPVDANDFFNSLLTVLKTRYAIQVEDPNIIYRVEACATPSRLYRVKVLPLGTGPSGKGR